MHGVLEQILAKTEFKTAQRLLSHVWEVTACPCQAPVRRGQRGAGLVQMVKPSLGVRLPCRDLACFTFSQVSGLRLKSLLPPENIFLGVFPLPSREKKEGMGASKH